MGKIRKIGAVLLAAAILFIFAACAPADTSWIVKTDDMTVTRGQYMMRMYSAFAMMQDYIEGGDELTVADLMKYAIGEQSAAEWIKDYAIGAVKEYTAVTSEFNRLGLELSAEDLEGAKSMADLQWQSFQENYENNGIAYEDVLEANYWLKREDALFEHMYGAGSDLAVTDEEIDEFIDKTYYALNSFTGSRFGEDGEYLSDEDMLALKKKFQTYARRIQQGEAFNDVADEYYIEEYEAHLEAAGDHDGHNHELSIDFENDERYFGVVAKENFALSATLKEAIEALKTGEASFVEETGYYAVIQRLNILETKSFKEDQYGELKYSLRSEEFTEYLDGLIAGLNLTINQDTVKAADPAKFVLYYESVASEPESSDETGDESAGDGE